MKRRQRSTEKSLKGFMSRRTRYPSHRPSAPALTFSKTCNIALFGSFYLSQFYLKQNQNKTITRYKNISQFPVQKVLLKQIQACTVLQTPVFLFKKRSKECKNQNQTTPHHLSQLLLQTSFSEPK